MRDVCSSRCPWPCVRVLCKRLICSLSHLGAIELQNSTVLSSALELNRQRSEVSGSYPESDAVRLFSVQVCSSHSARHQSIDRPNAQQEYKHHLWLGEYALLVSSACLDRCHVIQVECLQVASCQGFSMNGSTWLSWLSETQAASNVELMPNRKK